MGAPADGKRHTVCVDFDGVIHSYVSGWQGGDECPDPPCAGAIDWLDEVAKEFELVVLTSRAREPGGAAAVEAYLREHGYDGEVTVTAEKLPALVYVDDRAWRFHGKFPPVPLIWRLRPWVTGDPERPSMKQRNAKTKAELTKVLEKQHRLKVELSLARVELIREILRDKPDEWFEAWWVEAERLPWADRIELARIEAGQARD